MTRDPLLDLADLPGVADAVEEARQACERLRWHEAYRRRWREVRVEAGLRCTRLGLAVDGVRVPLDAVRALATGGSAGGVAGGSAGGSSGSAPAELARVVGALRATAAVERLLPDLGARGSAPLPPLGQVLAGLHTAAAAGWLDASLVGRPRSSGPALDVTGLGAAPTGDEVAARVDLLSRTVAASRAPGLVVAAVAHGEVLALRPFAAGNGLVARAVSRLLVTTRGLDPTGSVVAEAAWSAAPVPYVAAAAGFATGSADGVGAWLRSCAAAVVAGAQEAGRVADAVLAGRLDAGGL